MSDPTEYPPLPGTFDDLRALTKECAIFLLSHNAEPDAVDLLEELEIVDEIVDLVDDNNYNRVCQYMIRFVPPGSFLLSLQVHPSSIDA